MDGCENKVDPFTPKAGSEMPRVLTRVEAQKNREARVVKHLLKVRNTEATFMSKKGDLSLFTIRPGFESVKAVNRHCDVGGLAELLSVSSVFKIPSHELESAPSRRNKAKGMPGTRSGFELEPSSLASSKIVMKWEFLVEFKVEVKNRGPGIVSLKESRIGMI